MSRAHAAPAANISIAAESSYEFGFAYISYSEGSCGMVRFALNLKLGVRTIR